MPHTRARLIAALLLLSAAPSLQAQPNTTLLVNIDHRPATSLNGAWHAIVDPYATALYAFHHHLRKDGFFMRAPVEVPTQFIDDYDLHLSRTDHSLIEGYVHVENATPGASVTVTLPELNAKAEATVDANSRASISISAKSLSLWSPENPKLYKVDLLSGSDRVEDEIGFRTIETRGTQILLNGQPVFLRGISIHAEAPYRTGRAYSQKDVDTLLGWAKELGCNYVRLAHYPHDERMTRTADRLGLMVWSEIPDYWALEFDNPAVLAKSKQ